MFSVLARGERAPATLLALLAEVLPRRQSADRDERVGDDRPSAVILATRAPAPGRSTTSSLLYCHSCCLLLLYNFSADVGVLKKLLVAELDVYVLWLDPVLIRDKRKIPQQFIRAVIRHFGVAK